MYVFLSYLLLARIARVHGENSGRTVSGGVHPVGAQNKTLISDTEYVFHNIMLIPNYYPELWDCSEKRYPEQALQFNGIS